MHQVDKALSEVAEIIRELESLPEIGEFFYGSVFLSSSLYIIYNINSIILIYGLCLSLTCINSKIFAR